MPDWLIDPNSGNPAQNRAYWFHKYVPRLSRVLTPIYKKGYQHPEPVGTGVLIRVDDWIFLVSAAHVSDFDGARPRIFFAGGSTRKLPWFSVKTSIPAGGTRDDDELDIGYWILDPGIAAKVTSADTLRLSDLDLWYSPSTVAPGAGYFLDGFPATRQPRRRKNGELHSHTFGYACHEVDAASYQAVGRDRDKHLLVGYDKEELWSAERKVVGPDLHGMSGGAIWRLSGTADVDRFRPLLSAIAIRWRQQDPKCVIGTRIYEWARLAVTDFPEPFEREWRRLRRLYPEEGKVPR